MLGFKSQMHVLDCHQFLGALMFGTVAIEQLSCSCLPATLGPSFSFNAADALAYSNCFMLPVAQSLVAGFACKAPRTPVVL